MENKKTGMTGKATLIGKIGRKPSLIAALLLTAVSLSACIVAPDRGYRGDGYRHHSWNNDWHGGDGWQGNDWNHHR